MLGRIGDVQHAYRVFTSAINHAPGVRPQPAEFEPNHWPLQHATANGGGRRPLDYLRHLRQASLRTLFLCGVHITVHTAAGYRIHSRAAKWGGQEEMGPGVSEVNGDTILNKWWIMVLHCHILKYLSKHNKNGYYLLWRIAIIFVLANSLHPLRNQLLRSFCSADRY